MAEVENSQTTEEILDWKEVESYKGLLDFENTLIFLFSGPAGI